MTKIRFVRYLFALCLGASIGFQAQSNYSAAELDVVYYDVTIELMRLNSIGKSVVTSDFTSAMEQAAGKSLKQFFAKWVYLQND